MKVAIFILSNIKRITQLKTCLYFLFKHYNSIYKHPVIILGSFTKQQQNDILDGIREECKSLLSFKEISLTTPKSIDNEKLNTCIEQNPTNDWGTIEERNEEYFWITDFWNIYAKEYDYVMRLDDDVYIEEPIKNDFFNIIDNRANHLLFCMLENVCPIQSFGMRDFFAANFPKNDKLDQCVVSTKIADALTILKIKLLYKTVFNKEYPNDNIEVHQPNVCSSNFMILRTSYFTNDKITPYINKIKELGYIHYFKWKSSTIYSLLTMVLNSDKVTRTKFNMSSEKNRTGKLVPSTYKQSGCTTSK
jgi:hypothetical protein